MCVLKILAKFLTNRCNVNFNLHDHCIFECRTRFIGMVQRNDQKLSRRESNKSDDKLAERHGFLRCDPPFQARFNVSVLVSFPFQKHAKQNFHFDSSDFNSLSPHNVKENCKKAFDAGDQLGIPRVIEPSDMDMLAGNSKQPT